MIPIQYRNSPVITAMADFFAQYFDPKPVIERFYQDVSNIDTANSYGLDVWGRIVGANRFVTIPALDVKFWGFDGTPNYPFNQGIFYVGERFDGTTPAYRLADPAYRVCIYLKALLNICKMDAHSINRVLKTIFAGRGDCFVIDNGDMTMDLEFRFALEPWEIAVLQSNEYSPVPAGVGINRIHVIDFDSVLMFRESGLGSAFGEKVFFSSEGL